MTPEVEDAVAEFAADCGPDCYKMPKSCETYLQHYLADYPTELNLMAAALEYEIPARLARHDTKEGYDDYLSDTGEKLAKAAGMTTDQAKWAVGAWGFILGRPVGYQANAADDGGKVYHDAKPGHYDALAHPIMTVIVTAGGFLGAALGAGIFPLVIVFGNSAVDASFGVPRADDGTEMVLALFVAVVMAAAGLVGGLAALVGWLLGKGNENPWASFGVAFGAAFTSAAILLFIGSIIAKPIILFAAVLGATYKSSARGGNY